MREKIDVLIIGAGPAGIFTAIELLRQKSGKHITVLEKGCAIEKRVCPKQSTGKCMNCKNCAITTGFSG
ncbi:MAG: FAD-dependent oxidoreductase, partial [Clostridia bacterium]|nr:FAD-dependent oxidoreductase [Clostridia bacterium]